MFAPLPVSDGGPEKLEVPRGVLGASTSVLSRAMSRPIGYEASELGKAERKAASHENDGVDGQGEEGWLDSSSAVDGTASNDERGGRFAAQVDPRRNFGEGFLARSTQLKTFLMSTGTTTLFGLLLCQFIHCLAACTIPSVTPTWMGSSTFRVVLPICSSAIFPVRRRRVSLTATGRKSPQRNERRHAIPWDDRRRNMALQEKLYNLCEKAWELIPGGQPHSLLEVARAEHRSPGSGGR